MKNIVDIQYPPKGFEVTLAENVNGVYCCMCETFIQLSDKTETFCPTCRSFFSVGCHNDKCRCVGCFKEEMTESTHGFAVRLIPSTFQTRNVHFPSEWCLTDEPGKTYRGMPFFESDDEFSARGHLVKILNWICPVRGPSCPSESVINIQKLE